MGVRWEDNCVRSEGQEERGSVESGSMRSDEMVARRKRVLLEETKSLKALWRASDAGLCQYYSLP